MDLFDAMHSLRAMRRLKPDPISDEVLQQILEAAIRAPSGGNRQSWFFLLVREAQTRKQLAELWHGGDDPHATPTGRGGTGGQDGGASRELDAAAPARLCTR